MIDLNWQLAASTQSYGANTFYSPKYNNQYEKTRHAIFSLAANISLNQHITISPTLYFNQFNDHYQLIRNQEGAKNGENYHTMNVYGASLNFLFNSQWGKTSIGSDLRKEHLLSTAYGELLDEKDWMRLSQTTRLTGQRFKRLLRQNQHRERACQFLFLQGNGKFSAR